MSNNPAPLAFANYREFWLDREKWPSISINDKGRSLIFLLEALHQIGLAIDAPKWNLIKSVYLNPELARNQDFVGFAVGNEQLHKLLLQVDLNYAPKIVSESYGGGVSDNWYAIDENRFNRASL